MSRAIPVIAFLLSWFAADAQISTNFTELNLNENGKKFRSLKKYELTLVLGKDEAHLYQVMSRYTLFKNSMILVKYDTLMRPVLKREIELSYDGNKLDIIKGLIVGDRYYIFSTYKNKGSQYIVAHTFDPKTLKLKSDHIQLAEYPDFRKFHKDISEHFTIDVIDDTSQILIGYHPVFHSDKHSYSFEALIIDTDLQKLWSTNGNYFGIEDFKPRTYCLTNKGNVFVLGSTISGSSFLNAKYKTTFIGIFENGKSIKKYYIEPETGEVDFYSTIRQGQNEVVVSGFVKNENDRGCYYLSINEETRNISQKKVHFFEPAFIAIGTENPKIQAKKIEDGEDVISGDIVLVSLVERDDGRVVLIGEDRDHYSVSTDMGQSTQYYWRDIYIVCFNKDGTIYWNTKIPKYQAGGENRWFSFDVAQKRSNLYFIFNDNKKNINYDGTGKPAKALLMSTALLVHIDKAGNTAREKLTSHKNIKGRFLREPSFQISKDHFYFFAQKGTSKERYGLMRLD